MKREFKSGDWVQVKNAQEIARTLDHKGTLDGLPFMPEMVNYCGRRFRILRFARKACVEYPGFTYQVREVAGEGVVLLEGLRCSGDDHDGCGRACVLLWKVSWLHLAEPRDAPVPPANPCAELAAKLKNKTSPTRYYCQSTQMSVATKPLSRLRMFALAYDDVRTGSRGLGEMIGMLVMPAWRKATKWFSKKRMSGPLKKTPVGNLELHDGELVQIKAVPEIEQTLDSKGRNRGLVCDMGMAQYSGGTYRVRSRLDRLISEPTGEMREMQGTVILEGLRCLCWNVFGGCPRDDYMYWREIWLNRTQPDEERLDQRQRSA